MENVDNITMIPHKSRLGAMDENTRRRHINVVSVEEHNQQYKANKELKKEIDPDEALAQLKQTSK